MDRKVAAGKRILAQILNKIGDRIHMRAQHSENSLENSRGKRQRVVVWSSALVMGLILLISAADQLWAAIELAYYRAAVTNSAIYLEWATVREVNVNGFEILCKPVDAPETAYHPIGSRIAQGRPSTYNFDITSGLIPGERYCFRLREVTSDQTPGEVFDLCGYGLGLTPPPTSAATVVVSIPVTLTPTTIPVQSVPGLEPAPTLAPTQEPLLTLTPATLTPTPPLPAGDQSDSPIPTPTMPGAPDLQQQGNPNQPPSPLPTPVGQDSNVAAAQISPAPTLTPIVTDTPFPTETPTVIPPETPTATATLTAAVTATVPMTEEQTGVPAADAAADGLPLVPEGQAAVAMAEATPTPLYMVVTATPTPQEQEALAALPPTFTPWPTAVPTASFSIDSLLVPNTQNLMVGLLCLIFLSASGLGALGLVTSVIYMRSQTRRDRLPGPVYDRRRY